MKEMALESNGKKTHMKTNRMNATKGKEATNGTKIFSQSPAFSRRMIMDFSSQKKKLSHQPLSQHCL